MGFHTFAICAYGKSPYLEACIRSLKSQTVPTQIICVTSTPSAWLEELLARYEIPLFVRVGEKGIGNDWNYAVEKAEGRFVTVTHQDDLYNRHYVEELRKAYERWPDMSVFMSDGVLIKNGRLNRGGAVEAVKKVLRLPWRLRCLCHLPVVKMAGLIFGNPVMCPSCSYGKHKVSLPLFSDEYDFVLDWECMRKLALREGRFVCIELPLLYYRIHDHAATKACMENHKREKEERQMFEKIWPGWLTDILLKGYSLAGRNYD